MVTRDPRIDAYIKKSPEFSRPIMTHLRALVHAACPSVIETIKWGAPSFEYKGMLCGMAAFKAHCSFGFWKHEQVVEDRPGKAREAMGSFGRLTQLSDLPSKAVLSRYVKKAMKLNDDGVKAVRTKTRPKKPVPMHPTFKAALAGNSKARKVFDAFSPSAQREYLEWIADAKTEATRERRLDQAIEWISEGKQRNWKYTNC
ncbi:MAG: YdeI/OmpD-associated family protein [Planctomycetes bacterium]|nr:YdeI/OmpD-associated family protein [Planctomycetota bacterium]